MRKYFILVMVFTLILAGCPTESDDDETALKISNQSSYVLDSIKWQNVTVATSLDLSSTKTVKASEGSGYLYFTKNYGKKKVYCRTNALIHVEHKKTEEFVFIDNTLVVDINDSTTVQRLGSIVEALGTVEVTFTNSSQFSFERAKLKNQSTNSEYSFQAFYDLGKQLILVPVGKYTLSGYQKDLLNLMTVPTTYQASSVFSVFSEKITKINMRPNGYYSSSGVSLWTDFIISEPE